MVAIYIIVAIFIFGCLIMIHEFGHYFVARRCGVDIEEFSIGMGPKIFQKQTKKTGMLFSVRALPIGGYVSMKGEEGDSDDPGAFRQKSVWRRMAIVAAGAMMNLLLGFLIVCIIVCMAARTNPETGASGLASTTIAAFGENATSNAEGGLMVGDRVISVGRVRVHTGEELVYEVGMQGYRPLTLTVVRDGGKIVLHDVTFPTMSEQDISFGDCDFYVLAVRDPNPGTVISTAFHRSISLVKMVWDSLINLITGRFGFTALSGPIGVTGAVHDTIQGSGWSAGQVINYILYITALISVNLGVFNLIPFPALDGGRLFFLVIEAIFRVKIPAEVEAKINFAGIVLLMGLMVFVAGKDIVGLF